MNQKKPFLKREEWLLLVVVPVISAILYYLYIQYPDFFTKPDTVFCSFLYFLALSLVTLILIVCLGLLFYPLLKTMAGKIGGFLFVFLFSIGVNFYYFNVITNINVQVKYEIQDTRTSKDTFAQKQDSITLKQFTITLKQDTITLKQDNFELIKDTLMLNRDIFVIEDPVTDTASIRTNFINVLFGSINNSLSVFFPSRGNYRLAEILKAKDASGFLFWYYVSHLLAYIYFALLAISVIYAGRRMMNRARELFYLFCSKKYAFAGANEPSILLAKDIIRKSKKNNISISFFLPHSEINNHELFEKLDSLGFIVKYVPFDGSNMFKISRCNMRNCNSCFFLDDNEDINIKLSLKLMERLKKIGFKKDLKIYIRTEIEDVDLLFSNKPGKAHIHIFNQSDITARQFVMDHPMLLAPKLEYKENNILILGFGYMGRELLKKTICDAQYSDKKISVTVIDEKFETHYSDFLFRYKEAIKEYNIKFNPDGINYARGKKFFSWLLENKNEVEAFNLLRFNRIFVVLGDSRLNIDVAQTICNLRRNYGLENGKEIIFAHINEIGAYNYFDESNENRSISIFGNPDKIYTEDVVINETIDTIAKVMHYCWALSKDERELLKKEQLEIDIKKSVPEAWCKAKLYDQNSSRAAAAGLWNIALLNGYKLVKVEESKIKDGNIKIEFEKIFKDNSIIEKFAELEHLRWNAYTRLDGISRWNSDTIKDDDYDSKIVLNGKVIKHLCLVDYAELDRIEGLINENINRFNANRGEQDEKKRKDFKEYDRLNVWAIPVFLKDTKYWIEKI
ncbi:MAG: PMF1/NNF1 family protein [Firmicutes bacterium]|nr:PMF1/NNF1 family protein [Bacillota bacterium]